MIFAWLVCLCCNCTKAYLHIDSCLCHSFNAWRLRCCGIALLVASSQMSQKMMSVKRCLVKKFSCISYTSVTLYQSEKPNQILVWLRIVYILCPCSNESGLFCYPFRLICVLISDIHMWFEVRRGTLLRECITMSKQKSDASTADWNSTINLFFFWFVREREYSCTLKTISLSFLIIINCCGWGAGK